MHALSARCVCSAKIRGTDRLTHTCTFAATRQVASSADTTADEAWLHEEAQYEYLLIPSTIDDTIGLLACISAQHND